MKTSTDYPREASFQPALCGSRIAPAAGCNVDQSPESMPLADLYVAGLIAQKFQASGYRCLGHLEIVVEGRSVTLRGKLPRYYLKQMAFTAVRSIAGMGDVHDEVEIV